MSAPHPIPSATLVVLRETAGGPELLLLERAARRDGGRGPHVFPGGKIEVGDLGRAGGEAPGARAAAVRETHEECGLRVEEGRLRPVSRWVTPEPSPRRFDTWFYATLLDEARAAQVQVDGREIVSHRWLSATAALDAFARQEIRLAPPTFVTIHWMLGRSRAEEALDALAAPPFLTIHPRILPREGGACILYPGDAGYEERDLARGGPRHRLWSEGGGFRYERSGV